MDFLRDWREEMRAVADSANPPAALVGDDLYRHLAP
jgi:hypothetical protein